MRDRLRQFVNTRAASFQSFTDDGGVLISTRFGDAAQLHIVETPGGARTQITFYREPIAGGGVRPGGSGDIFFVKDQGGDEFFQGFLYDPDTGLTRQLTETGARNQGFAFTDDGARLATGWRAALAGEPIRRLVEGGAAVAFAGNGELVIEERSHRPLA